MERRKKGSGQITYVSDDSRKSKWKASVSDDHGKRIVRYFKTEREAKAFLREVNSDSSKLKSLKESGVTFDAFSSVFLEEKKKGNMKPASYAALEYNVELASDYLGNVKLSEIDSDMVQQMVFSLAAKGYSESVMDRAKKAAYSILKLAAAKHYIDSMPVLNITIPRATKQDEERQAKKNWMRDDEMALYEAECVRTYVPKKYTKHEGETMPVHPSAYKLLFLLHTGLRLGEALALTWTDYDEYSKTVMIDKNMVYINGQKLTQTPKTESGERLIVLNRQAAQDLEMLRKIFDQQTEELDKREELELMTAELRFSGQTLKSEKQHIKEKYTVYRREHKYVCGSSAFPYGSGCDKGILETHKKICKAIGLSHNVTVHGLRHTYVTHYYLKHKNDPDFDLATFSKSIGHSSIRTTMEIYAHLDMTQNRFIQRSIADLKDF